MVFINVYEKVHEKNVNFITLSVCDEQVTKKVKYTNYEPLVDATNLDWRDIHLS